MPPPAGHLRPGRYLLTFLAIVVILYALVFFTGNGKPIPKLGIDLQGGTTVTLTARTTTGKPPDQSQLNQARNLIQDRVNGIGVAGTEVVLDGNNVVITVPGEGGEEAKSLGQTAKLNFRSVIGQPISAVPVPQQGKPQQGKPQPGQPQPNPVPGGAGVQQAPGQPGQGQPGQGQQGKPQGRPAPASDTAPSGTAPQSLPHAQAPPPAAPPSTDTGAESGQDPKVTAAIQQAKATRQSTDPKVQQTALQALDCSKPDPLLGNDDPNLPLVTCDKDGKAKYVLDKTFLDGQQIATASSGQSQDSPGFVVNLTFKSQGTATWAKYTTDHVGKEVAVVLDGKVESAPRIDGPIPGGNTEIKGSFSQQEAQNLAQILQYGSLPLSFNSSNAQTVSATLGLSSLEAGLIAGGIGLLLVFAYCLVYYRALGLLTILSLVLSNGLVYAVLVLLGRWIGYSLNLAGVAGLIIAIGITADSFVILFERLKDEVREGRTFRSAVPRAWVRARRTILSADAVSFLAAAVLYILAVGDVQGFAFTLGMSTVLDLVVVFLVTHPLVALASKSRTLSKPAFSGLGAVQRMGAAARARAAAGSSAGASPASSASASTEAR